MSKELSVFYETVLTDPLFAAEGMNLESAEKAIRELERATLMQENFYWEHAKNLRWFLWWRPFAESLRPVPFLKSFIEAERKRRDFLAGPSLSGAEALIATWELAGRNYKKSAERHLAALKLIGKIEKLDKTSIDYQFHKYIVSFTRVLENIKDILINADGVLAETARRKKILRGYGGVDIRTKAPINPIPYSLQGLQLRSELQNILEVEKEITRPGREYGPIYYTLETFDGAPKTHQFFVYLNPLIKHGFECFLLSITLADERYFLEIEPSKYKFHQSIEQYEPMVRRGIPFFHYHPTAAYAVRDLLFWADLATIADITWLRPELDKSRVLSQKSSLLDMLLWHTVSDCYTSLRSIKVAWLGGTLSPLSYLYIARSFPSLYYLTFNRSVWRMDRRPNFNGSRFTNTATVHKTYDEIADQLTPEILREIFEGYRYRAEDWKKAGI